MSPSRNKRTRYAGDFHVHKRIVSIDGSGNVEDFVRFDYVGDINDYPRDEFPSTFTTPVIAPTTFGQFGGHLIYAHFGGAIAISDQGNFVPFFDVQTQYPFGSEFGRFMSSIRSVPISECRRHTSTKRPVSECNDREYE